ncbi:MAG: lipid-A-disaccharide synthase [Candidatus Omnitrophica bacterium]|nr:lipid-A-disaccharide synthase [Candidatus Omnitrophota bacterium]
MTPKKIFIISGEPSGDLHASNLVRDLKSLNPALTFYGIGGELSAKAGVEIIFDITKLALVGAVEVLRHIFTVKAAHDAAMNRINRDRPDIAILVDYPGFNLKIARDIAKKGIPVVYYISPQIWAWGRQRIHIIKKYISKMLVFFKFEEEMYRNYGVDVEFVGHPLVDVVKASASRNDLFRKYSLSNEKKTIAILPGSRISEIGAFLPIIADAAGIMSKKSGNIQFLISKHPHRPLGMYEKALSGKLFDYRLAEGDMHNIVSAADIAIAASGTATLETAMLGTPLIIVYKANPITYLLYKAVSDTRFIGLVNIIAGKEVAPELLQYNMTAGRIAAKALDMLSDSAALAATRRELAAIKSSLGPGGASMRAARAILPLLR